MNGPHSANGKQRGGKELIGASYVPAPSDVRSSLQYSALASLTPASAVIRDIPPITIAFGDYITCNPADPEYARIGSLLDNPSASKFPDISLHAVRGLINQADVSYVRFKSPSVTFQQPSFDYAINPQFKNQHKRPFEQTMEIIPQGSMIPEQTYNHDFYGIDSLSYNSTPEIVMNKSSVSQRIDYNHSSYKGSSISPTQMISNDQREQQNTYNNENIYNNSIISNTLESQEIKPSSLVFLDTPAHSSRDYHPNVYSEVSEIPQTYRQNERHNSPHVVIESTPISKSYIQSNYNVSKVPSDSDSQEIESNNLIPQVVIDQEKSYVKDFNDNQYVDSNIISTAKRQSTRAPSPKVVIEVTPRNKLEVYRSPQKSEFDSILNLQQSQKKSNQEYKKHRDRDKDEERNGESALINLINYMSTIFEAEDSVDMEQSSNNAFASNSTPLLVQSSMGSSEPLLTTSAIQQLTKLVNKVSRYKRMEDAEVDDLARLLKILDRSVREVENLDVLPKSASQVQIHATNSKTKVNHKNLDNDINEDDSHEDEEDSKIRQMEEKLEKITNGIDAAIAAFSIMTGGKLSKQLYPEDLITSSLNLVKNQLGGIIYRFLELSTSNEELSLATDSLLLEISDNSRLKRKISGMLPVITTYLKKLYDLMQQEELSDSIVITVSFIAIGPFFVDSSGGGGNNFFGINVESMKLVALGLLRLVFTNNQKQRTWILEEILTSLIKLPTAKRNLRQYRLPDGKSIQMVSALILQLIQSCTAGTNQYDSKDIDGQRKDEILRVEINDDVNNFKKCGGIWKTGIDAASVNAGYVFKFLLARCTKSIKNSNDSEYRVLLDNFMEDVITVLNFPEWPAAEMIVHIFSKIMVGYINDKKADTYTKSMAIDYLGTIAGRIKKYANNALINGESTLEDNWENKEVRHCIDMAKDIPRGEITSNTSLQAIKNLWECQKTVLTFLKFVALQDPGVQCARQFYLAEWGYSFVSTLQTVTENLSNEDSEDNDLIRSLKKLLDKIIAEYWQMFLDDNINQSLEQRSFDTERSDISLITELLATRQALYQNFDSILSRILVSLDTGVVAFRTKALRALGQVVVNDPNILSQVNVRQTIAQRLSDNSPAVRDAAIDLVGRYLSQKPEITEQYYKVISERILDTGLNVRKRVIKLLRDIYLKSTDQKMMIDIGCKILMRINDDDNHVKDLALKTIQELWFVPFKHQRNVTVDMDDLDDDNEGQSEFTNMYAVGKKEVLSRSLLIVGVAGRLGERNGNVLGGLFKKIIEKDGKQKREILNICQCMVDCLFEHLLTLQDSNSKTEVVSCISTICLLSNASPSLVRRHVATLQPYLKSASSTDEQTILYYVLIIYRSVLPLLKRPNPSFLTEVEQALLGLLTKSPQKILQEVVPCLCVIVDKLTHNYARLTKLLRSCIEKLKIEKNHLDTGKEISSARNVMVLLLIIGLLCKNFDFDKKRTEHPDEMKELNLIDKGPIIAIVFQLALYFCGESLSETVQKMALQSLGFIYLSYPIIMLRPESTSLMDRILSTGVMDMKIQLMKVFADFLVAEQQKINTDLEDKKQKKNVPVDLKVLIGNADEFAEAGVSSSLMQRYLDQILECTFDQTQGLKTIALDVLGNIIQQGLAHPVLCMPTIVAIETSPEQTIRDKAFKLHQLLNEKHASLIHSRNVDCVKKAYAFQKQLVGNNLVGYAVRNDEGYPEALLNPMYSLLKEKRQRRNDFLISIVRTFDFDLIRYDESMVDVGFCKFVAENLATIDYKSLEEVLHVIYCINRVLSVVAISILHSIQHNAKVLNINVDAFSQNKFSQEQILDNVQIIVERNLPLDSGQLNGEVKEINGRYETLKDNINLNSTSIDIQSSAFLESVEKMAIQDVQERESINKDKETILPLPYAAKVSICMAILMYLKEHLKKAYALSEAKCQNFNPAQSGSNKDKPALRQQHAPPVITWEGLPFVDKPLLTDEDIHQQCELFRKLMSDDGTQEEEFANTEMEADSINKQSNGYVNVDFDVTTMSLFDETTPTITKSSGGTPTKKGIVRKLGSKSKNTSPRTPGSGKKRSAPNDAMSKKSKKKRKSVIDNVTDDEEDSDFQL